MIVVFLMQQSRRYFKLKVHCGCKYVILLFLNGAIIYATQTCSCLNSFYCERNQDCRLFTQFTHVEVTALTKNTFVFSIHFAS